MDPEKSVNAIGGVGREAGQYNRRHPNRVVNSQDGTGFVLLLRRCENLVCALKVVDSMQAGGDNLLDMSFGGLQEQGSRSRLVRRKFNDVDNQETECCVTSCTSFCASTHIGAGASLGHQWSIWLSCQNSTLNRSHHSVLSVKGVVLHRGHT